MYIWQQTDWPRFRWDGAALQPRLDAVRLLQRRLLGKSEGQPEDTDRQAQMDALVQSAIRTSEIEGENLDVESVRSSVARHLGLEKAGMGPPTRQADALVELLLEATRDYSEVLTLRTLLNWQSALFTEPSVLNQVNPGQLRGDTPMQVVSGRIDRPVIHFEAPPRAGLEEEVEQFLHWFNHSPKNLNALLRAGIAHLWLVTLHPFEDGNGRVARAVTDRALAQAEQQSVRFYSLSAAIMARRKEYYLQLERAQKGGLDITPWLEWFLSVLEDALQQGLIRLVRVMQKTRFWRSHAQTVLSERQIKVLNRLLDSAAAEGGEAEEFPDGINARKYMSMAKVSKATATRELADLLEKSCLRKLPGGGRSTRYELDL
ncbi:MAG: Fic family protein [Gammaproteobacteria bacterium]